jgi:hypothetical protein
MGIGPRSLITGDKGLLGLAGRPAVPLLFSSACRFHCKAAKPPHFDSPELGALQECLWERMQVGRGDDRLLSPTVQGVQ